MYELINEQEFKARKIHVDHGFECIRQAYNSYRSFDGREHPDGSYLPQECFADIRAAYLMENGPRIMPGDKYVRQCGKYDGEFGMFKTKKVYWDLINSLNLLPDD